jgi:hypothetical protein
VRIIAQSFLSYLGELLVLRVVKLRREESLGRIIKDEDRKMLRFSNQLKIKKEAVHFIKNHNLLLTHSIVRFSIII